jgi:hypothetical protein
MQCMQFRIHRVIELFQRYFWEFINILRCKCFPDIFRNIYNSVRLYVLGCIYTEWTVCKVICAESAGCQFVYCTAGQLLV